MRSIPSSVTARSATDARVVDDGVERSGGRRARSQLARLREGREVPDDDVAHARERRAELGRTRGAAGVADDVVAGGEQLPDRLESDAVGRAGDEDA
jgi:hypothetical protein